VELNDAGALISAVAVSDPTGEVAGHCSLQPYGSGTYAECGQGVVAPAHRGHALSARLLRFLEQEALRAGLRCLVSHEVTSHPAMQLLVSRVGYKPCALALAAMPATLNFRKMTGTHPQRESCSVSLRYLTPPEASVVCAPSRHREMLRRIYASLGKPVTFESPPSPSGPGKSAVHYNGAWGIGDIHVHRIGTDTAADIRRSLRDLCEIGDTRVVYLALPLDQGGTEDICRAAEEEGFFFAGLGSAPAGDGESLYLQYVDTELDLSLIQIATPMGKEIFEYVAKERLRVGR
jgi:GNAT superfamily N-acetyltransferase